MHNYAIKTILTNTNLHVVILYYFYSNLKKNAQSNGNMKCNNVNYEPSTLNIHREFCFKIQNSQNSVT